MQPSKFIAGLQFKAFKSQGTGLFCTGCCI